MTGNDVHFECEHYVYKLTLLGDIVFTESFNKSTILHSMGTTIHLHGRMYGVQRIILMGGY